MNYKYTTLLNYTGTQIEENYRWLENESGGDDLLNWIKTQRNFTKQYLKACPYREQISLELSKLVQRDHCCSPER